MAEVEGVIKFRLDYVEAPLVDIDVTELNIWRGILKSLDLIGQLPERYDGYGFGNVSQRFQQGFVISGTQTGGLDHLSLSDHALCTDWDLASNTVVATGSVKPSSESLSHAAVYDIHHEATCALHVHSPDIWNRAEAMGIAITDPDVPYGTPQMAEEVRKVTSGMSLPGIFSMGGHEDGVFTFGRSLEEAGLLMIAELVRARAGL